MSEWLMLGFGLILTIGTGLFVASEFSMVNLERSDLEARRERGERGLSNSIRALAKTSTHLSGAQLGITLTTMLTGFLVEPALTALLRPTLVSLGVGESLLEGLGLVVSMFLATLFSTLIGELVPKKLALTLPLQVNKFVVGFQLAFTWVFSGMIFVLNKVGNAIVRSLGIEPKEELSSTRTAEELSSLVRRSASMGALDAQTATLLTKTLALSQLVAADVMTPRPRMHALDKDASLAQLIEASIKTGHSRFPISDGSTDDIIGVAHVKQAAAVPREKREDVPVSAIMVEAPRVPETMRLETLMVELRAKGLQLAIVVDEYGGTSGLVSLEDVIEEIVGDISDEFDDKNINFSKIDDKNYLFEGKINLKDFYRIVDVDEELFEIKKGEAETLAGFILEILGNFPKKDQKITFENCLFTIETVDKKRIRQIKVTLE